MTVMVNVHSICIDKKYSRSHICIVMCVGVFFANNSEIIVLATLPELRMPDTPIMYGTQFSITSPK